MNIQELNIQEHYIQELDKMKDDAYKYPIYSHLGIYLPRYGVLM